MLPAFKEFDELVEKCIAHHKKRYGRNLTRLEAEEQLRLDSPAVAAREIELRESAVACWERLGMSPEAARIAARVQEKEFTPKTMTTEDWANFRFGR